MPVTILKLCVGVVSILISSACAGASSPPEPTQSPGEVTIGEAEAGRTIRLTPGDTLVVSLPANPGTGYSWELQTAVEGNVLEQAAEPEFITSDASIVGAPGMMHFRFTALGSGEVDLRLEYRRAWEANTAPVNTFQVSAVVE